MCWLRKNLRKLPPISWFPFSVKIHGCLPARQQAIGQWRLGFWMSLGSSVDGMMLNKAEAERRRWVELMSNTGSADAVWSFGCGCSEDLSKTVAELLGKLGNWRLCSWVEWDLSGRLTRLEQFSYTNLHDYFLTDIIEQFSYTNSFCIPHVISVALNITEVFLC